MMKFENILGIAFVTLVVIFLFTDTKINLPIPSSFNPSSPLPDPNAGKPNPSSMTGDSTYT